MAEGTIGGASSLQDRVSAAEWATRVELAAAFRIGHHLGWNDSIRNHIAARVPDAPDTFLMNPRGPGWHEIRASDLIKADMDGNILSVGGLAPGVAGFNFHRCILRMRPDLHCTLHTHETNGVVVSAMPQGLEFYDQTSAALWGRVSYHDFEGLAEAPDEGPRIVADLGRNHAMILRNHGLLTVGRNIGEAVTYMAALVDACEIQVRLHSTGVAAEKLSDALCEKTGRQLRRQRDDTPYGALDWQMYLRLAERLDPGFAT